MSSTAKTHFPNHNRPPFHMNMIQGNNVNIGYANLEMTFNQVDQANLDRQYALNLLRSNCSLGALVDANERYDPPRCTEGTRHNIMQKMEDWVRHDKICQNVPSSIFWLYGGAGAGKSALAQTIAEKFELNGDLAASFFFFRTDKKRNDGNRLIPTLAFQLVHSFQGITPFMEAKILSNRALFDKNRRTQMLELLIEPLTRLSIEEMDGVQSSTALKAHPRLVVIDGLDECGDPDIQYDLLQIISSSIPHLPYPLRFLITSRPESHITHVFEHDLAAVARYNLSNDSDADMDIRNFLYGEFTKIRNTHPLGRYLPSHWPPRGSISSVVEHSSGHFIYASTVIRFIQSPKHRPDDRLQVILGLKKPYEHDRPYARLDSLYTLIFLQIRDHWQLERIHHALGIIHLRSLKCGFFGRYADRLFASDHHVIETLLELRPGDLFLLFEPLLSLVIFEKDDIRVLHKSLFDYLLDSSRSGDLRLDLGLAHETGARCILSLSNQAGRYSESAKFQDFAYHCQFARLNDNLTSYLRSLACNPSLSMLCGPYDLSCSFQSMLSFLHVIGRQDFDSSGRYYRTYVDKKTQCLRLAVPCSRPTTRRNQAHSADVKKRLRLALEVAFGSFDSEYVQVKDANGFNGRTPIPAINTSIIKSIEREHGMFSAYIRRAFPEAVSFLAQGAGLIHSCHFGIQAPTMMYMMFLTYTRYGVRLSCSEFGGRQVTKVGYHDIAEAHYKVGYYPKIWILDAE